jgi:hypothetical protein
MRVRAHTHALLTVGVGHVYEWRGHLRSHLLPGDNRLLIGSAGASPLDCCVQGRDHSCLDGSFGRTPTPSRRVGV